MDKKSLGTSVWLGIFMVFSLLLSTSVIGQVQDITPPSLVEFGFSPNAVNVSNGDQTITVTARFTDDLIGFSSGRFYFLSPSDQLADAALGDRISGTAQDGIYRGSMVIPQFSENGVWHFWHGSITDGLNSRTVFAEDLVALGAPTTFTVGNQPPNQPPTAKCHDVTVASGSICTAPASINNGSNDLDGDPITLTQSPAGPYSKGNTLVTLTVTDGKASSQCTGIVTVVDQTPPVITSASANPPVLWPPNQKMVDVTVNYRTTDNCGRPACQISSLTSNERMSNSDYAIVDAHHVKLTADRLGSGKGRIYTITITCKDDAGNPSSQTLTVTVPHDQGKK